MVAGTATLRFFVIAAGHCTHSEHVVLKGGRRTPICFPSLVGVIIHPTRGVALFDAGYNQRFLECSRAWPYRLYRTVTPVSISDDQTAVAQLQALGIRPDEVRTIVISHFHSDHIAGISDFPQARFICARSGYELIRNKTGILALRQAFLPGLLPADFDARTNDVTDYPMRMLPESMAPFDVAYDVFGDGSALVVPLPGHAEGHIGLFLPGAEVPTFMVGDAAWLAASFRDNVGPAWLATFLFRDRRACRETLTRLHTLHQRQPGIRIVPSHCQTTFEQLQLGPAKEWTG